MAPEEEWVVTFGNWGSARVAYVGYDGMIEDAKFTGLSMEAIAWRVRYLVSIVAGWAVITRGDPGMPGVV